ncbi:MAG: glycosyltransferase family 4 protein [bacterium]
MTQDTKKTKILYCITKSVWGGAGKYVFELATSLPKDEFEASVVLGGNGTLISKLNDEEIKTISIPSLDRDVGFFKDIASFNNLLKIFKKEKPDVIHLNSSKMGGIGALAGQIAGVKKIIFTAHGWPFNEDRGFLSRTAIWLASYITALFSTEIIVIDKKDFKQAQSFPFCKNKIILIHNGIKPFELLKKTEAKHVIIEKIKFDALKEKVSIGTIGELHKNKGLEYGINAIALLPQETQSLVSYFIIGGGEEKNNLEHLIKQLKLEDKVFLLGFMDDARKYLNAFDVFLFPSVKEGLPYSIMEAGFASLPIITTKVGGIPDIMTDEKSNLLVEPKNTKELRNALVELIQNKKIRDSLGAKNKENILTKFTFEKMLEKTIKAYK